MFPLNSAFLSLFLVDPAIFAQTKMTPLVLSARKYWSLRIWKLFFCWPLRIRSSRRGSSLWALIPSPCVTWKTWKKRCNFWM